MHMAISASPVLSMGRGISPGEIESHMRNGSLICLSLLSIGLAACADTEISPITGAIVLRWIDHASIEDLQSDDLYESEEVFRWTFADADDRRSWRLHDLHGEPVEGGRLRLLPSGDEPRMDRDLAMDATSLDQISVTIAGLHAGDVALRWAGPFGWFSDDRSVVIESGQTVGDNLKTFVFDLHPHPKWTGRISRIRLEPIAAAGAPVGIATVVGTRRLPRSDRLADAVETAWRVDLDRESRTVLLAPPGRDHERELRVPAGALLQFGYALQHGITESVRFEVFAERAGDRPQRVFFAKLDPRLGEAARWHDATVRLDEFEDQQITLRLVTQSGEGYRAVHGLPMWSNPEIIGGPPPDLPNVLLVCLDTLRADHLSSYGWRRSTSPRIDRWAANEATVFETVVATSPWTLPSHVSMFTGLDAVRHGVNHYRRVPADLDLLAEQLRGAGYSTAAITGGGYLRPQFGLDRGFDTFRYWKDDDSKAELATGLSDALAWLEHQRGRPFFLFFHTYEIHFPHRRRQPWFDQLAGRDLGTLPKSRISMESHGWHGLRAPGDYFVAQRPGDDRWQSPLNPSEKELVSLMYDSAVAYADDAVGQLLDRLEELGLAANTVVVITSDHGEALGEDDRAGHSYLEDYNTLVPLIIRLPGHVGAGRRVSRQVRLVDLAPTIIEATGAPAPASSDGLSLLHLMAGEPSRVPAAAWTYAASSNRGLALRLDSRLKYTFNDTAWEQLYGRQRLIDLRRDPKETTDLSAGAAETTELMERTRAALVDQQRGVRLIIRNSSSDLMKGRLRGALAAHDRLKSASAGDANVRWRNDVPPTFEVPQGEELVLLLDSPDRNRAGVNLHMVLGDGRKALPLARWFDLDELDTPAAFELAAEGWREVDNPSAPPATGFILWWEGGAQDTAPTAPQADIEVLDQLRALGYVQ